MWYSLLTRKFWVVLIILIGSTFTSLMFQNCGKLPEASSISSTELGNLSGTGTHPNPLPNPLPNPNASSTDFYQKVKPILESRCLHCHSTGSIASHLPFETSDQVASHALAIKGAIQSRSMPPFDVSQDEGCNSPSFANDPRLSQTQIDTISNWINQKVNTSGKLIDSYEKSISLTNGSASSLVADGLAVFAATMKQSFTAAPPIGKVDQYRCFVMDSVSSSDKYMTAYQVVPGNPGIVHHIILYQPSDADINTAQALDKGLGYDCAGAGVSHNPLVIWAPGVGVQELPPQTGLKVRGGKKLILEVHYNTSNSKNGLTDKSKILLRLADTVQAPADWLAVGANSGSIPAGVPSYLVSGNMTIPSGYAGIYGVFPHMHAIGKKIRIENSSSGQCYSFTPNWRFEWQLNYFYNSMAPVVAGNQLQVKCTYDSTSKTTATAFGENSANEMCFGFIYAVRTPSAPIIPGVTDFSITPNISGTVNSINISATITYKAADVSLPKQIYVVAAVPKSADTYDYFFRYSEIWNAVGTDLGAATWTSFQTSQNSSSDVLTIISAADISSQPAGTIVYVGYGVARNGTDAKGDLLANKTWGLIYQKP